jgi:IS4 transposase
MSDLEKARKDLDRERAKTDRRTSVAQDLIDAFKAQHKANNWRTVVEKIVRGST